MKSTAVNYVFPAIISKETNNYGVYFHDLPGCIATGDTLDEALHIAKDGLALHLWGMEQDGTSIPAPTPIESLSLKDGETLCLLEANMMKVRAQMDNRPVQKTLTIPWYLNEKAEELHIDCSQVLQSALRERLVAASAK